ncbi:MAG: type II toxin-antitoxin system VapC family toxin [Chitinispirillales bacterium]|jgi:hypothetical protein|nr:type II toxin-antitoxin system VapC family toxin [Chitinispirillales bacterium]
METPKKSVYIETTIPSVITSRPSQHPETLYRQTVTKFFWENERNKYDLFISNYVVEECEKGDQNSANKRLDLINGITYLDIDEGVETLAREYYRLLNIPTSAKTDSFHLALCVLNDIDFILSWNLKHFGQRSFLLMLEYNVKHGLHTPVLCTPGELLSITNA